jgi:hypothetical protein
LLNEIGQQGTLDLVAYNVGNNAMIPSLEIREAQFETMWRQNALGGFLVGREAVRRMLPKGSGTILYTGATASLRARPPFLAFASAKAWRASLARKGFTLPMWSSTASSAATMPVINSPTRCNQGRRRTAGAGRDCRRLLGFALPAAQRLDA